MSKAHSGSRLILKNQIVPVQFDTSHFNFQEDAIGIRYGERVNPIGIPVYSLRDDGLFSRAIAIEQGTTNLATNGNFSNGLSEWTLSGAGYGNSTLYVTDFYGKTCLYQDVASWNNSAYYFKRLSLLASTTYTVSFMVYRVSGVIIFDPNGPWNTSYSLTPEIGKWVRYEYTFTTGGTGGTEDLHFYADSNRAKYYLTEIQVEQASFATSYVDGTRGGLDLNYPLYDYRNISGWVKANYVNSGWQRIVGSYTDANKDHWYLGISGDTLYFRVRNKTKATEATATISQNEVNIRDGSWHFFSISFDDVQKKIVLRVDNVVKEVAYADSISKFPYELHLGKHVPINAEYWNGLMSEFRVDSYVIGNEESSAWYESQAPFYNPYDTRAYAY